MTKHQEYAVERIKQAALNLYGFPEKKEIKRLEVKPLGARGKIAVVIEVGYIGDEGTMNEIFSRHRGHFFIGARGGIKSTEARYGKRGRRTKALRHPLIYGFTTFGSYGS